MLRIYGCIVGQHDLRLVALAALICLLGCYTTLSLLARAHRAGRPIGWSWLTAAAAVSGAGVWATHFVGMLAFEPGLAVGYDIGLTIVSIAISVIVTWLAFAAAVRWQAWLAGGLTFGTSVAAMHFTGMAALSIPARISWDPILVAAALAICAILSALALRQHALGNDLRRRSAAAALLTGAIAGLHFTAMGAVSIEPDPTVATAAQNLAPEWLAVAMAIAMVLIVMLGLVGAAVDQRFAERAVVEADRLRAHVSELEATKRELEATTQHLEVALEAAAAASQSKTQFLATMSHELRTPLNAIIGFSEIIANGLFGPVGNERYGDFARNIHDSGRHLLALINDVLDFSRLDAGRFELQDEVLDLADVLGESVRMVSGQAREAGVTLCEEFAFELPQVRVDRRRIRQIALNLLSNAVKFTPSGGTVSIRAFPRGGAVFFTVRDTGIGIASGDIPRALERFGQIDSSLNRKYEGTGLGLPLAKRLAELHGGVLELTSTPGDGTTVTVTLPPERVVADRAAA